MTKRFPERTQGVFVLNTDEKRTKALKATKIGDVLELAIA
jgi:DNA polymerase V